MPTFRKQIGGPWLHAQPSGTVGLDPEQSTRQRKQINAGSEMGVNSCREQLVIQEMPWLAKVVALICKERKIDWVETVICVARGTAVFLPGDVTICPFPLPDTPTLSEEASSLCGMAPDTNLSRHPKF